MKLFVGNSTFSNETVEQYLSSKFYHFTLSIFSLRNLDIEANKFYNRAHRLYDATVLTRCYT